FAQRRHGLLGIAGREPPAHAALTSIGAPQRLQTRTRDPLSRTRCPIRVGWSQLLQTSMTLPTGIGSGWSRIPPGSIVGAAPGPPWLRWRGFVWRLATLTPSTTTYTPPVPDVRR